MPKLIQIIKSNAGETVDILSASCTADHWKDRFNFQDYLGMTIHYIREGAYVDFIDGKEKKGWNLAKRTIACKPLGAGRISTQHRNEKKVYL